MDGLDREAPEFTALVDELRLLRLKGIVELRRLALPALAQASVASGRADPGRSVPAPAIEALLREAVGDMEGGRWGEAAALVLGLAPGTRGDSPAQLRQDAAERFGVSLSRWRNHWERRVIEQIADLMLGLCHAHQMHLAHLALERRTPAASRLAVAWVERFGAYYSIWTPIYALGADLIAYRSTLLEEDRPYDREPTDEEPGGYSQEMQATGYGTSALFHLAAYLNGVERFITTHGGLWLLSDQQAETEAADAIARIRLATPLNERDDSYLRIVYAESGGEHHRFRSRGATDSVLADLHAEWQAFLALCECTWTPGEPEHGYFPTHRTHPGIDSGCQTHAIAAAANDYCLIIDHDWDRIADWYHLDRKRRPSVSPEQLYIELREWSQRQGDETWPRRTSD